MLATESNTTTVVGRLRVRSQAPDPYAEEQRLERLLRGATLRPHGLPDSATLVVRRFQGRTALRMPLASHDMRLDASWQQAVTDELDRLRAQAARPALGQVPPGANAVLFLDRAELLAAMGHDWLSGTLESNWWWREFLRGHDAAWVLFQEWRRSPESLPAACEILGARSRAVEFVRQLPGSMISDLMAVMAQVHALPTPNLDGWRREPDKQASTSSRIDSPEPQDGQVQPSNCPPWLPWVPEASAAGLTASRKVLLAQALMLRRAPGRARTVVFQNEIARWQATQSGVVENVALPDGSAGVHAGQHNGVTVHPRGRQSLLSGTNSGEPPTTQIDVESDRENSGAITIKLDDGTEKSRAAMLSDNASTQNSVLPAEPVPLIAQVQPSADEPDIYPVESPAGLRAISAHEPTSSERTSQFEPEVMTAYGGIFFLLNVTLFLNLYGDFTSPLHSGIELNIWDFLALLGSEITGGELEDDALWKALANLAGRPKEQRPGADFQPPCEWKIPPDWLSVFPPGGAWQQVLRDGRRLSFHPAGFLVSDDPCEADAVDPVDPLKRWLGWLAGYMRARLVRAMGREDAIELVCRAPAKVLLTKTHVNVHFSLNSHPIEVRLAGVDRDPGWIPAAGRYIAFHFD